MRMPVGMSGCVVVVMVVTTIAVMPVVMAMVVVVAMIAVIDPGVGVVRLRGIAVFDMTVVARPTRRVPGRPIGVIMFHYGQ